MQTDIKVYAPVIIPTLNRDVHFKRCFESLERCTGADKTTVYVALDYPPSDKYADGWKKIDEYLKTKEVSNGFGELIVIRRDHNYGVCHENGNYETLIREIKKQYDRFIFTEDDNEFSPCFLEYQNKCLERFKNDDRINLVCGYNYMMQFPSMYKNNFYITKWGCPWGTGHWCHKEKTISDFFNQGKLRSILLEPSSYNKLTHYSPSSIRNIVNMLKAEKTYGDAIRGVYSAINDTYCVMPCESMVRNYGNDGTGDHCKRLSQSQNDYFISQPISESTHFEFTDDIFTYEPARLERQHYKPTFTLRSFLREVYLNIVYRLDLFLLRRFNYLPKSKYI